MGYSFRLVTRDLLYEPSEKEQHIPRPLLYQSWSSCGNNYVSVLDNSTRYKTNSWLKEITTHLPHFIYGYMVNDHSSREENYCCHYMGYSFQLTARDFLYASSLGQHSTYHGLCYTSRGALAGTRSSSMRDRFVDLSHYKRTLNLSNCQLMCK